MQRFPIPGEVVGDPTEAALVVLAAKIGADAPPLTRRTYPRVATVPFDSAYKFMATYHHLEVDGVSQFVGLVKGGPDVVLARCSSAFLPGRRQVPIEEVRDELTAANQSMSEKGLRVLAFAVRRLDGREDAVVADPMSFVEDLTFVGMAGIIDPLRPEAVDSVRTAHRAGIEVRMITGDHATTAAAIGAELGLGPGSVGGGELQAMTDEELSTALPNLHVFGRVTPQDKLRLVDVMQSGGAVVAMTGDAVNDAAALKKADIGVAMGSGSEVTKQAGKMVLTDDNFGTLITAITLGRNIYGKIVSYIRYQMSKLFSLVLLFLAASIFNINEGVALTPLMVLFQHFFITLFPPVAVIMLDPPPPDLMNKPPRDPKMPIAHRSAVAQWLAYGVLQFAVTLAAMLLAPGEMSTSEANVPMTTAFVVLSLGSILAGGLTMRRDPESGVVPPVLGAIKILTIPHGRDRIRRRGGRPPGPPHDNLTDRRPVARLPGLVADHPGCRRVGQGNSTPPPRTGTCATPCDHRGCPRARPFAPLREENQTMMWAESLGRLPGVATARGYRREWLRTDVTAGLVLTALLIPAGMGYAEAAGLPAYAGLYATIVPLLAYAVVGPSKILVLGPDSSLAPLIAAAVIPLAVVGDSENALALAGVLAILVGLILVIGGFLRLGFVTELLSKPIRLGYLNAIALVVVVGQIPKLLGFSVDASGLLGEIGGISKALVGGDVDPPLAAAIGVGSLVVIVASGSGYLLFPAFWWPLSRP